MSDYEEEDEAASPEEKLAICRYFIMDCPPGHVSAVVAALKKLNCEDVLQDECLKGLLLEYHSKVNSVVPLPDGSLFVVDSLGQDGDSFFDPVSDSTVTLDPIKCEAVSVEKKATLGTANVELQHVLQTAASQHISNEFSKKCAVAAVFGDSKEYTIVIAAEKKKLQAFWSGRWQSKFVVSLDADGQAKLSGELKILCHYFEEGNVQLRVVKPLEPQSIEYSNNEELAKAVFEQIHGIEANCHNELDQLFQNMALTTFKAIRRALPINGRKFAWKDYKAYELATNRNKVAENLAK